MPDPIAADADVVEPAPAGASSNLAAIAASGDAAPRRFELIPGERLPVHPPGAEFSLSLDAPSPKPWISEEKVERDKVGFEDIGRVTALRYGGADHMLVRAKGASGGGVRYLFRRWPSHEAPRAIVAYPEDEIERQKFEANEAYQRQHAWTRRLLLPLVGGLPVAFQEWVEDKTGLTMGGASRANAMATAAAAALMLIFYHIIGPFASGFGASVFGDATMKWLALYLTADAGARLWHTSPNYAPMRNRETDEIGWLALELPTRGVLWFWRWFRLGGRGE